MRKILWIFLIAFLMAPATALAQVTTGTINGTVKDEQGAVIPGAVVTATHTGTNTVYTATTRAVGTFTMPTVRLGRYRLAVESDGFRRGIVENVLVEVGQIATVNVSLQVGIITEEIIVTSDEAQQIINTSNAELSTVVDSERIANLPLDGRNATHLALMQAGVFFERTSTGQGDKLIVHGQRHRSLMITLDGNDTQDNFNRASSIMIDQPLIALNAENVQEFKISTGNTSAEFGRGGAHISAVTKAGSNDLHGAVYLYHRNDATSANEFFNSGLGLEVPKLIRNQFGGGIGGPIIEDKTFFYFGYMQTRESRGIPVNRTVWSAAARTGLFSFLDTTGSNPVCDPNCPSGTTAANIAAWPQLLYTVNPTTGGLLDCSGLVDCFADNYLSTGAYVSGGLFVMDPLVAGSVIPAMPLPNNNQVGDGVNRLGFRFNARVRTTEHLPSFRLDHKITDSHHFFGTANYTSREIDGDFINSREPRWPNLGPLGVRDTLSKAFSLTLRSTLGATMVNEARAGVTAGQNGFPRTQPFNTPNFTLDFDDITDPYSVGGHTGTFRDNQTWHIRDSFSWLRGNHSFKFGAEWRHRWVRNFSALNNEPWGEIDFNDTDNFPGFSEDNIEDAALDSGALACGNVITHTCDMTSGDRNNAEEMFNNLVGAIGDVEHRFNIVDRNDTAYTNGAPEIRRWSNDEFDFFINDTWQFNPNLTINLGLRWEYANIPDERDGLIFVPDGGEDAIFGVSGRTGFFNPGTFTGHGCDPAIFPFTMADLMAGGGPALSNTEVLNMINGCATPNVFGGGKNGRPLWNTDMDNFAPVVSLAWDVFGDQNLVIRTGYRISYFQDHFAMVEDQLDDNEGLRLFKICEPSDASLPCQNPTTPNRENALLRNLTGPPLPIAPPFTGTFRSTFLDSTSQDIRTFIDDLETPYYQEWNLGISHELWENSAIEVRYVGSRGLKLRRNADFNEININALDPVTGQTFLDAFVLAQVNLACNRSFGDDDFSELGNPCNISNPLMNDLIAGDPGEFVDNDDFIDALDFNEPGSFVWSLTIDETSDVGSGGADVRGGAFLGQVLQGRFPANFFVVNPFIASSRFMTNDGISNYHAMEVEFRRRMSNGLTLQANYTFGKALSDYDGDENVLTNDERPSSVINRRYMYGQYVPRHQFNANWLYELPVGPGKALDVENSILQKVLGDWKFGGIIRARTGRPFSFRSGVGTFHRPGISDDNRVNLSQNLTNDELRNLTGRVNIGGNLFWFDPCMSSQLGGVCTDPNAIPGLFQLPNAGELGTSPPTPVYGPGRFTVDFNLIKNVQLTEQYNLAFHWDVFNATNTANFGMPSTNMFSSGFGQITTTTTQARIMQFALRISF